MSKIQLTEDEGIELLFSLFGTINEGKKDYYFGKLKETGYIKEELKPCPFCGTEVNNIEVANYEDQPLYYIYCYECEISVDTSLSIEHLKKKWNKRVD